MNQNFPGFGAATRASMGRIAVLADGENLSLAAAQSLMHRISTLGDPTILRAYCSRQNPNGWDKDHRFQVTYLDTIAGKNSADIRLVIDAMDIAHAEVVDAFFILSTDCDFAPLAHRLRNVGLWVVGAGRAETSDRFRLACSEFHVLEQVVVPQKIGGTQVNIVATSPIPVKKIDAAIKSIIQQHGSASGTVPMGQLGNLLRTGFQITRQNVGIKTWKSYLQERTALYLVEGEGVGLTVRLTRP